SVPSSVSPAHRALHSFPTRRSSDLLRRACLTPLLRVGDRGCQTSPLDEVLDLYLSLGALVTSLDDDARTAAPVGVLHLRLHARRSEEHTSELQSRENLVCRLLLEKK